eukprot:499370-Pelagomonas_calceolata.AAC.1
MSAPGNQHFTHTNAAPWHESSPFSTVVSQGMPAPLPPGARHSVSTSTPCTLPTTADAAMPFHGTHAAHGARSTVPRTSGGADMVAATSAGSVTLSSPNGECACRLTRTRGDSSVDMHFHPMRREHAHLCA